MGNQAVKGKFSSLESVLIDDKAKRFKFWSIYQGTIAQREKPVTVFEFKLHPQRTKNNQDGDEHSIKLEQQESDFAIHCAKNALKFVRQLRHPSVLKFVDCLEVDDSHFLLATEPVVPLRNVLHTMEYSEILLGLNQIATAISWLNEHCNIVHNNIHLDSIYVSKDKQSRWILGDFQLASPLKELSKEFLERSKDMRYSETITPEEGMREFSVKKPFSRDSWAFAKCISLILIEHRELMKKIYENPLDLRKVDFERQFNSDSGARTWLVDATNSNPLKRASCDSFVRLSVFLKDPFCHTMLFFDDLRLKQTIQKEKFFRELFPRVQRISGPVLKRRVIPRMLTLPFVTEPAASSFLPHLFTPKKKTDKISPGLLEEEDYKIYLIPFIQKCFQSKNLSLRIRVLQHLEYFMWYLDEITISKQVIPGTLIGLRDINDDLVMFSMNALAQVTRYLSSLDQKNGTRHVQQVTNAVLEVFHHYVVSSDNTALRSHSLMAMIEMWNTPYIEKPLIFSALQHALYDTNYEIKLYALNVILLHMHRFDPREYVTSVLKNVLPLILHEKAEVRHKANQVMKSSLDYIQECDTSTCNLGPIARAEELQKYAINPHFPSSSRHPLERRAYFTGAAPSVNNVIDNGGMGESKSGSLAESIQVEAPAIVVPPVEQVSTQEPNASQTVNQTNDTNTDDFNEDESEDWDKWDDNDGDVFEDKVKDASTSVSPLVTQNITSPVSLQAPPVVQTINQKQSKLADKFEEIEDDSPNGAVDYFSELGMDSAPSTKKASTKSSKQRKQQHVASVVNTVKPIEHEDMSDDRVSGTIQFDDSNLDDVTGWGLEDDLTLDTGSIESSTLRDITEPLLSTSTADQSQNTETSNDPTPLKKQNKKSD